ncbi:sialate O-acetylesterase [Opitutaceae bacterium EW11]|nr:sialate O-acetylesterase [Opitutaceae bacterium EW11]
MPRRFILTTAALLLAAGTSFAEVALASPFTSHMVLQRDQPVPVWGTAAPGEQVSVDLAGETLNTTADSSGKWRVSLEPLPASSDGRALIVRGSQTSKPLILDDVLVGEVWLASGQSNMDFRISKARAPWAGVHDEEKEIAAANCPLIRIFTGEPIRAYQPQDRVPGEWQVCSPQTAPNFSAVAYYFARELQKELNVPVGVVVLSYGASCAQAWIRRDAILADGELRAQLDRFDGQVSSYRPATVKEIADWQTAADKAKAAGKRAPRKPGQDPVQDQHNPTVLYNGMIAPIVPFAIRGVVWYQGESITEPKALFPRWNATLIQDWRKLWGRELPFYFCQLAALDNTSNSPQVREWQAQALELPNTAMVVTIDVGDRANVHPKKKQPVGERLARIALARDYGRSIEYSGPLMSRIDAEGSTFRIHFSHTGTGLVSRGGELRTFEICGPDGAFVPAVARIDGATVVVRNGTVPKPVGVRYAWANYPEGANLFNAEGLPAAPFRINVGKR